MARFLFIHQNFPGQFRHLAPALVRQGHEVRALHLRDALPGEWEGVRLFRYVLQRGNTPGIHPWLNDLESKVVRGEACLRAMQALRRQGFSPDGVFAHLGWGEGLFAKDVWPQARFVVYGEWFYRAEGGDVGFDPEFSLPDDDTRARLRLRNANQLLHLEAADAVLAPTVWQAESFPPRYRDRITVIHDGIDTARLHPAPARVQLPDGPHFSEGDEIISFVNRNLEPYRGYHQFMRALPALLAARPRAHVVLVGGSRPGYGATPPDGRTWRDIFADEIRPALPAGGWERIHFTGPLPYDDYVALLRCATVHVYLTYPFVLSWSLLEAMSLGCAVVASDTAPVREVIVSGRHGRLVDFFQPERLAEAVAALCDDPDERARLGRAARERVRARYDLHRVCLPAQLAWLEARCAAPPASSV